MKARQSRRNTHYLTVLLFSMTSALVGCSSDSSDAIAGTTPLIQQDPVASAPPSNNNTTNTTTTPASGTATAANTVSNVTNSSSNTTNTTSHARTQQQFQSSALLQQATSLGQTFDFNAQEAVAMRELLEGTMVVYENSLSSIDSLISENVTLVQIYCPGGALVMFKTVSTSAFNLDAIAVSSAVSSTDPNTERLEGVWETAVVTGFNDDGTGFVFLNILSMIDFSEAFRQQGQTLTFPTPAEGDVASGQVILTPEGQALAPVSEFWIPVAQANQSGVVVVGHDTLSPRLAIPNNACS